MQIASIEDNDKLFGGVRPSNEKQYFISSYKFDLSDGDPRESYINFYL
jgi:hypothetical protein